MSLLGFCEWLASTRGSVALLESLWAYPIIESIHVLGLTLFLGLTVILDLRLLGLAMRRVPVSEMMRWLMPWIVAGFVVMIVTGLLLFYAIPVRTYQNIFFRIKVAFLIMAGVNIWIFHAGVYRRVTEWDRTLVPPRAARAAAALSLVLWTGVVFGGRMIAYNWFDCDRQPQPALINLLAGCRPDSP